MTPWLNRTLAWSLLATCLFASACSSPARIHIHGNIRLAHPDSEIPSGLYTGREMQKITVLGGHDFSRPTSSLIIIGLGKDGSDLRFSFTNNGHDCDLRINSAAFSNTEELQVTVAVPGHGKATRYFAISDPLQFDLDFLAVIPRR